MIVLRGIDTGRWWNDEDRWCWRTSECLITMETDHTTKRAMFLRGELAASCPLQRPEKHSEPSRESYLPVFRFRSNLHCSTTCEGVVLFCIRADVTISFIAKFRLTAVNQVSSIWEREFSDFHFPLDLTFLRNKKWDMRIHGVLADILMDTRGDTVDSGRRN